MTPMTDRTTRIVEIVSTILLSLATVASAWSAYEAARWGGVQASEFADAGSARVKAATQQLQGSEQAAFDSQMYAEYQAAIGEGDRQRARQIEAQHFRPEFREALEEWRAGGGTGAPPVTTAAGWEPAATQEGRSLDVRADIARAAAADANQDSDNYVLTTVLFAMVLFFAGMSSKFAGRKQQLVMLAVGSSLFAIGVYVLTRLPYH